jgi:hypothetical protein
VVDHVADKLAARLVAYGRSNRPSTRVEDLIELVVPAHCAHISADDAIVAVGAQGSLGDLVLPGRFDSLTWTTGIGTTRSKRKARGLAEQTPGEAVSTVGSFVDPILAGTATGSWDPVTLRWRRRS